MERNPRLTILLGAAEIGDDGLQWIEVLPAADKSRNGPWYFTITAEDLDVYAERIAEKPGQIPVDYDHADSSTRAAGWFTGETQKVDAGEAGPTGETQDHVSLWAQVKWTPQARQEIQDGVFKRISPEWSYQAKDQKTGLMTKAKDFIAATLTNRPFFKELAPVGADAVWGPEAGFEDLRCDISEALNPAGGLDTARFWVMDISLTTDRALVSEYGADRTWVVPFTLAEDAGEERIQVAPASDWIEAEKEWVAAATAALRANGPRRPFDTSRKENAMPEFKALAAELGLADDADEDTITAAVKALKDKQPAADAVTVGKDVLADLTAKATKGEEALGKLQTLERDTLLAKAVEDGKILPVQKTHYETMYDADPAGVTALIDATPAKAFDLDVHGTGGPGRTDDDRTVAKARKQFESDEADGVIDETVRVDVRAREILAEAGKATTFTDTEYLAAAKQASSELAV